jgi:Na+/proline symporter
VSSYKVTWVNIAILLVYSSEARLVFGWYFERETRVSGSESYLLGGRDIRWPILDLSFMSAT